MKKLRDCLDKKADKNTNKVAMDFETSDEDNEALTPHLTRDSTKKEGGMILEKKYGPLTPLDYLRLFTKENKYIRYHNISWFKTNIPWTLSLGLKMAYPSTHVSAFKFSCNISGFLGPFGPKV